MTEIIVGDRVLIDGKCYGTVRAVGIASDLSGFMYTIEGEKSGLMVVVEARYVRRAVPVSSVN